MSSIETEVRLRELTRRELAIILVEEARSYRNGRLMYEVVPRLNGEFMKGQVIREVIKPFIKELDLRISTHNKKDVTLALDKFAPRALEIIHRNKHLHKGRGVFVTQNNADALLVLFVNLVCEPLELNLSTNYLLPQ